jgi:hypothetical protein
MPGDLPPSCCIYSDHSRRTNSSNFEVLAEDDIHASSGTDLTGKIDTRGLGDNTEAPD